MFIRLQPIVSPIPPDAVRLPWMTIPCTFEIILNVFYAGDVFRYVQMMLNLFKPLISRIVVFKPKYPLFMRILYQLPPAYSADNVLAFAQPEL